MKKILLILGAVLVLFTSCHTSEKIIYFQDLQNGESLNTQAVEALKVRPGDRISAVVSSAKTPEQAARYNLVLAQQYVGTSSRYTNNYVTVYTVDENGNIDVPAVGRVKVSGLTRAEVAERMQSIFRNGILNDAVVTVSAYDQYVTLLGDVKTPGRVSITRDNITLLEAIGAAGDLNITARRDRILVLRQEGNETKSYYVDIRTKDFLNSPVYNLRQNDVVIIEPNRVKMGQSTNNDNAMRSVSTWISIASFLTSLAVLIFK